MKKVNQYADIISGLFVILFSVSMFAGAGMIQQRGAGGGIGPRTMPQIIAALLAIVGVSILISGMKKLKTGAHQGGSFPEHWADFRIVIFTLGLLFAYVAVLTKLGFLIATAIYLFIQLCLFENEWKQRIGRNILVAVITSAGIYFLFRNVFSLMLPTGTIF